jgi:hypothetical protein
MTTRRIIRLLALASAVGGLGIFAGTPASSAPAAASIEESPGVEGDGPTGSVLVRSEPAPNAETPQPALTVGPGTLGLASTSAFTITSASPMAAWRVSCGGAIDNAHYSSGAQGVIYKTRITCKGTGSGYPKTVSLTSSGALYFGASKYGTYKLRATSKYTQIHTDGGGEWQHPHLLHTEDR